MTRIGFYAATLSSMQQEKSMEVIANNLANVSTPGYKKDMPRFRDFIYQTTYTSMGPGRIRDTENPMDVAINGDGMLRVQSDDGILYTRGGSFCFNKDNTLVTQEGWPVLGQSGQIQLSGTSKSQIRIERNGQIFDGNDLVDTLYVAQFPPEARLDKVRNGYFKPAQGEADPQPMEEPVVQQGALEEANFNLVEEMTHMIETTRAFEAYQKVVQILEQQDSQITNKLGA